MGLRDKLEQLYNYEDIEDLKDRYNQLQKYLAGKFHYTLTDFPTSSWRGDSYYCRKNSFTTFVDLFFTRASREVSLEQLVLMEKDYA